MAKTKISEFSSTPANNTDIDSINIAEGCAPSNINDAIRELMAQLKDFQIGSQGDSFNGPIGTSTAAAGAFTTLTASSTLGVTGVSTLTGGAVVQGLTVGRGAGAVSTNTAVGASAMANMTSSGFFDVAVGYNALYTSTSGIANNAIGYRAMYATTTGANNQALGASALAANTTGSFLVAVGDSALAANTTGNNSVAIGQSALQANTTASNNTAVGYQAGYNNTTGTLNTFIGPYQAGYFVTTGSKNTILGGYNGNQGGLDIRTSSNYIVLSDGDGNPRCYFDNVGTQFVKGSLNTWLTYHQNTASSGNVYCALAYLSGQSPNNTTSLFFQGEDTTGIRYQARSNGGIANYSANNVNLSDRREKTNFAPAKSYLDIICSIPVQTYNYIDQNLEEDGGLTLGVVAQDVQAVAPELVTESNWGTEENPKMRLSIYQTDLQYALMKALQELKAEFDAYKATHP